ncbi:hypothetical protein HAX54_000926 [Datura stramonium]|uniref:Uncharacterized protein n=1 Tax=Datura stramonium TaxID=4076 RepID=A0ABS8WT09_DATST|nr:hypothetical protein [Datura stramonium]
MRYEPRHIKDTRISWIPSSACAEARRTNYHVQTSNQVVSCSSSSKWKGERKLIYPVVEMVTGFGYISPVNSDRRRRGEVVRLCSGEGRKMKGRAGDYFGGFSELMESLRKMNRERGGKEVELQLSFVGGSDLRLE